MGTRSITTFESTYNGEEIVVLYRQYDGYPDGHGRDLASLLAGGIIVNGLTGEHEKVFNGMSCLAAQVIAALKDGPGNFYLYPAGTRDVSEEYKYVVKGKTNEEPQIEVWGISYSNGEKLIAEGTATEVLNLINEGKVN